MQIDFTVEAHDEPGTRILAVSGELSLSAASALENELNRALESGVALVVVDLKSVEFIDSTGLSVLVRAHQQAADTGIEFGIINAVSQVDRLLRLTGLTDRLTLANAEQRLDHGN